MTIFKNVFGKSLKEAKKENFTWEEFFESHLFKAINNFNDWMTEFKNELLSLNDLDDFFQLNNLNWKSIETELSFMKDFFHFSENIIKKIENYFYIVNFKSCVIKLQEIRIARKLEGDFTILDNILQVSFFILHFYLLYFCLIIIYRLNKKR